LLVLADGVCNTEDYYLPSRLIKEFCNNFVEGKEESHELDKLKECCCHPDRALLKQEITKIYAKMKEKAAKTQQKIK
jgi:hypothetical protein